MCRSNVKDERKLNHTGPKSRDPSFFTFNTRDKDLVRNTSPIRRKYKRKEEKFDLCVL